MTKKEELDLFLERSQDLINSKYILADIKIVNLLKVIASSETLIALFKNCLLDFNYDEAKKKYLVKSQYLSEDKGEFVLPANSKDLLALVFNVLVDIDAKRIKIGDFIGKYFYVDGSFASGYDAFINAMIVPFIKAVKILMESVIDGKLQDPVEALTEEENRKAREKEEDRIRQEKEKELATKVYGANIQKIKEILLDDKQRLKANEKIDEYKLSEMLLVVDMLANAIMSEEKDAIIYASVAYKFMAKANKFLFRKSSKKVLKLLEGVLDGI